MTDNIKKYLSWEVVGTAAALLLLSMMSMSWSDTKSQIRDTKALADSKVSQAQYERDIQRIEKKLDTLISLHMKEK